MIDEILKEELDPVDLDDAFEQSIRECYPEEIKVGWLTLNTVTVMKDMDPVSWRCAGLIGNHKKKLKVFSLASTMA